MGDLTKKILESKKEIKHITAVREDQ